MVYFQNLLWSYQSLHTSTDGVNGDGTFQLDMANFPPSIETDCKKIMATWQVKNNKKVIKGDITCDIGLLLHE